MGPQPNSCGNQLDSRLSGNSDAASMGPQPNSCGNDAAGEVTTTASGLQWGHSQTAVETQYRPPPKQPPASFNGATAKQLWKPGQHSAGANAAHASMGPQPNSCGNTAMPATRAELVTLQWGHSQTAVETNLAGWCRAPSRRLQWGHSQTAVET